MVDRSPVDKNCLKFRIVNLEWICQKTITFISTRKHRDFSHYKLIFTTIRPRIKRMSAVPESNLNLAIVGNCTFSALIDRSATVVWR